MSQRGEMDKLSEPSVDSLPFECLKEVAVTPPAIASQFTPTKLVTPFKSLDLENKTGDLEVLKENKDKIRGSKRKGDYVEITPNKKTKI